MSRPQISYPTPVGPGPSNYQTTAQASASTSSVTSQQIDTSHLPRRSSLQTRQGAVPRPGPNALDSSITRLLVVTKQLLQGLEQWAQGYLTEENVSDIYVRLGDGFETCVGAFHRVGISTRELESIPADLRVCLEQCLAEDPCQESLNLYLPDIRQIIYNLLEGLKRRQAQYKRNMANSQSESEGQGKSSTRSELPQPPTILPAALPPQAGSNGSPIPRVGRSGAPLPVEDRLSVRSASSNPSATVVGSSREANGSGSERGTSPNMRSGDSGGSGKAPSSTALAERERERAQRQPSGQSRPAPPDAFRPPRRIPSDNIPTPAGPRSNNHSPKPQPTPIITIPLPEPTPNRGIQLKDDGPVPSPPIPGTSSSLSGSVSSRKGPTPPRPDRFSRDRDSFPGGRVSRFSADSDITNGSPVKSNPARSPPTHIQTLDEADEPALPTGASSTFFNPVDAPALPRLELPSTSISLNDDLVFGQAPTVPTPTTGGLLPEIPPESQRTLAALRGFDPLERRASKRYSSFAFNKMLPTSPNNKRRDGGGSSSGSSPQRPAMRRADSLLAEKIPPLPPVPEGLKSEAGPGAASVRMARGINGGGGETVVLEEEEGGDERPQSPNSDISSSSVKILSTPESRPTDPESSVSEDSSFLLSQHTPRASADRPNQLQLAQNQLIPSNTSDNKRPTTPVPTSLQVYLQLGRQVKKCKLEIPVTFEGLRLLFMEKFEYDSGLDDFPDVYLRDPVSGMGYELEEMEDVKEGAVLSLNIEPLDQVKQHFDQNFAGLAAEVKEMKKALDHSRRMSLSTANSLLAVSQSQSSPAFRNHTSATIPSHPFTTSPSKPLSRLPSPRLEATVPGTQLPSLPIRREVLEEQHDSLLTLRRDLAVMRQMHTDFLSETKTAFSALRTQNNTMKEVIKTKIGGSRALLDNSKAKLEGQCSETIQAVEEIQDVIDAAREDAYKRFVTPSGSHMKKIRNELNKALGLADRFASDVATSEGTWRATWAQELSRVKEEQNLLAHQRKLGDDLKNDLKDAAEMWDNVEAFVLQRKGDMGGGGNGEGEAIKQPRLTRGYRPPTPDQDSPGGGVNNLLMEIRTKEADPNTRLRAIEAQQRQREKERVEKSQEKDEFAGELEGFVNGRKLRKTGGTEEVERARQRRQELTLKKMLTGDQPPLSSQHTGQSRMGSGSTSVVNSPGGAGGGGILLPVTPGPNGAGRVMTPQLTGGSIGGGSIKPQITGSSVKSGSGGGLSATGSKRGSVEVVKEEGE